MTLRLAIRSMLTACAGLAVGFVGAVIVIAISSAVDPADLTLRMGAGYLTWFLLALVTIGVLRHFQPAIGERADAPLTRDHGLRLSRVKRQRPNIVREAGSDQAR